MIQDLIDHIRDDSTQYQVESAKAAIYGIMAIATVTVTHLPKWMDSRLTPPADGS